MSCGSGETLGELTREVREDEVGAGSLDGDEVLEGDRIPVDPTVRGSRLEHRVLAAHVVRRNRNVELRAHRGNHVEIRECRLHHHHVGALVDVERGLGDGFAHVRDVHLVRAAIAELRRALGRVPERSVQGRRVLGGVREDRNLVVARCVEASANGTHLPVHHAGRRDDVGTGIGLRDRDRRVALEGRVVVDHARMVEDAAMPVVGVLVEAVVSDEHEIVADLLPQIPQRDLHDAVGRVGTRPDRVLHGRHAEQDHGRDPQIGEGAHLLAKALLRVLDDAGHRCHRLRRVDALLHEQRRNEVVDRQARFGDEAAQRGGATQAAWALLGERHATMVRPRSPIPAVGLRRATYDRAAVTTSATELWGREGELEALTHALDDARNRTGRVALLEGEAGIGKTRLVDELCTRAEALGVQVFRGSAEELEQGRPFGALLDALGAPDAVRTLSGSGWGSATDARFLAQDAFVDRIERLSAAGPMMLAVDDAHWADRGTLSTLWALARRSTDLGLLLLLAFRSTPQPPELARTIEGCRTLGALHVSLGPIADDAVAQLAQDVVGGPVGATLLSELRGARGNPFVAIELLRGYDRDGGLVDVGGARELRGSGLPAPLRDTLLRRFTALSDEARTALSVASVLGGVGRVDVLGLLLDMSPTATGDAVAEATKAGLLEPSGDVLAFRHDLIREALYEDLPGPVRAGWHREAARLLADRAEPAIVARHLALGATRGDAEAVTSLARTAATIVASEPDTAAELLERALGLATDPTVRPELGMTRAGALLAGGRAEEALLQADAVLADPATPTPVAARAQYTRANAAFFLGRPAEAVDDCGAALATGELDETTAAYALAHAASSSLWIYQLDDALERADRALAEGRRLGITAVQVGALANRCAALGFQGKVDDALTAGQDAIDLAGDDPSSLRRTPHAFQGMALLAADRYDEARLVAEDGARRSTRNGQALILRSYYLVLARIAYFDGRWDDVLAEADTAERQAEDLGVQFGLVATEALKGLVLFHRGEADAARLSVERRHVPERGRDEASGSEMAVLLNAEFLEAQGKVDEAARLLLERFAVDQRLGMVMARLWPGPTCVRLALAAGDVDAARDVTAQLEEIAARSGTMSARATASCARGLVDADARLLIEAAEDFARVGRPLDRLQALEAAGNAHATAGQRDEAIARLRDAAEIADHLGATHDGRRVSASLRELGVRSGAREKRRTATHGWDALTDAEREVAQLVDAGLRNGEIAERLFVSRRTVESHMSRLYAKLAAENRVALAHKIREHAARGAA